MNLASLVVSDLWIDVTSVGRTVPLMRRGSTTIRRTQNGLYSLEIEWVMTYDMKFMLNVITVQLMPRL